MELRTLTVDQGSPVEITRVSFLSLFFRIPGLKTHVYFDDSTYEVLGTSEPRYQAGQGPLGKAIVGKRKKLQFLFCGLRLRKIFDYD